jgi:hypothetical protein
MHLPRLTHALAALDSVHGDGMLPNILVDIHAALPGNLMASFQINQATGIPAGIVINPNSPAWGMSLLHEIGHFLDWSGFGTPGLYASVRAFSRSTVQDITFHLITRTRVSGRRKLALWFLLPELPAYRVRSERRRPYIDSD